MGNVFSLIANVIQDALFEFVHSIVDIVVFLAILFLLYVVGWLISLFLKLVFTTVCHSPRPRERVVLNGSI